MAKIDLKFIDCSDSKSFIKCEVFKAVDTGDCVEDVIIITSESDNNDVIIWLDKSTAIKFAKTLRTEINKIQD